MLHPASHTLRCPWRDPLARGRNNYAGMHAHRDCSTLTHPPYVYVHAVPVADRESAPPRGPNCTVDVAVAFRVTHVTRSSVRSLLLSDRCTCGEPQGCKVPYYTTGVAASAQR